MWDLAQNIYAWAATVDAGLPIPRLICTQANQVADAEQAPSPRPPI
jgi:hypothetical protein